MNSSEMFNRDIKAAKLAGVFFKIGATTEDVINATEADWRSCAGIAGCNPPNPKNPKPTIDAVLAALARMYADEAAVADDKAEAKWEESQEYAGNRCPPRE